MSFRSNRSTFLALAAAAALSLVAPAQAKFVGTAFDPPTFSGSGVFLLPDVAGCLTLGDGFHTVNGGSDACTGVLLLSALVTVKDGLDIAHLSLPPPTPGPTDVTGIVVDTTAPQLVVGVNTVVIPISVDDCTGVLCGFEFWIQWDSGLPAGDVLPSDVFVSNSVSLFAMRCPDGPETCTGDRFLFADPSIDVKFFPAPEPGSLALLVGALGAGWFVRRRRA